MLKDTLIMTFSEFGRRVKQNGSNGTDHGTANNMFFIGEKLNKPGIYNQSPRLDQLDNGDLIYEIDFRNVYATVLDQWLDSDPKNKYPVRDKRSKKGSILVRHQKEKKAKNRSRSVEKTMKIVSSITCRYFLLISLISPYPGGEQFQKNPYLKIFFGISFKKNNSGCFIFKYFHAKSLKETTLK